MLLIALGFRNTDGAPAPEFTTNVEALIVRRRTAFKHACFTDGAGAGLPAAPPVPRKLTTRMDAPAPQLAARAAEFRPPRRAGLRFGEPRFR